MTLDLDARQAPGDASMSPSLVARLRIALLLLVAILVQTTFGSDLRVRGWPRTSWCCSPSAPG